MSEKPIVFIGAFALMAGCCLGVPLLLMLLGSAAGTAWLLSDGLAWLALVAFVVAVLILYRRSRRHAATQHRSGKNVTDAGKEAGN